MGGETSKVLTLVFTDLVDSTALKTAQGDAAVGELLARHREHVTRLAGECGGRVIDWAGDGCFLTFETSSAGVLFALKLQETHHWESALPRVRVGIHMGEVTEKPFDGGVRVEGLIVDLTARIGGLASPGQVLVSNAIQQSARQRLGADSMSKPIRWEAYGPYGLKGFDEPVDIREAGLEGISPFKAPVPGDKAWLVNEAAPKSRKDEIRRIAVLPFTSFSETPDQDWFVDGMTETLIAELAKVKALTVISRTSVMHYKKTQKALREIAAELNADALVEGSVMRAGDRVRITAQLIDGESDAHLWADRYNGTMEEILDLQCDVALAIAKEVNVALTPEETAPLKKSRPVNPEAFEALMKARYALSEPTVSGTEKAIQYAEHAISIDPDYADAYAWLATSYVRGIGTASFDQERAYTRARVAVSEARRLGGDTTRVYSALSALYRLVDWDWDKSLEYGRRAVEMDPSDSDTQGSCGVCLSYKGDFEAAEPYVQRAMEIDPLNPMAFMGMGCLLLAQRRLDDIDRLIAENFDRFPSKVFVLLIRTIANLLRGEWVNALRDAESTVELSNRSPAYVSLAGSCAALAGETARAEEYLAELRRTPESTYVSATSIGTVVHLLGRPDEAYALFFKGYHDREFGMLWYAYINFFSLAPFRDDERLQRLIARIGIK